jgi:hypothetical protein
MDTHSYLNKTRTEYVTQRETGLKNKPTFFVFYPSCGIDKQFVQMIFPELDK